MTKLSLAFITMMMTTAACADETPDRTAKDNAAAKPTPQAESATKPAQVAEAPKPDSQPTQAADAAKTGAQPKAEADKPAQVAADAPKPDAQKTAAADAGGAPYKASEDGKKVDAKTYEGYALYTNVCVPCHGRDATGGMGGGSNLVENLKKLSKDEVTNIILNGKPGTLMAGFKTDEKIAKNVDNIYSYLKGRSDGKIWGKSLEKLQ